MKVEPWLGQLALLCMEAKCLPCSVIQDKACTCQPAELCEMQNTSLYHTIGQQSALL